MEKIYCIFDIQNIEHLNLIKNYKNNFIESEQYHMNVAKEKWYEIDQAIKNDCCIFWNEKFNYFTDSNFNRLYNINNKLCLPRITVGDFNIVNNLIIDQGGKPLISIHDRYSIEHWFDLLPYEYSQRRIISFSLLDATISENSYDFSKYFSKLGNINKDLFFIKTINRDYEFHYLGNYSDFICYRTNFYPNISPLTRFIASEAIDILQDHIGSCEYRCFYIGGKLKNISRYIDQKHNISNDVLNFAKKIELNIIGNYLPNNVVVDICKLTNGSFVVVECNCVTASGRYGNNDENMFLKL